MASCNPLDPPGNLPPGLAWPRRAGDGAAPRGLHRSTCMGRGVSGHAGEPGGEAQMRNEKQTGCPFCYGEGGAVLTGTMVNRGVLKSSMISVLEKSKQEALSPGCFRPPPRFILERCFPA